MLAASLFVVATQALAQIVPIIANSWILQARNDAKSKEAFSGMTDTIKQTLGSEFFMLRQQQERLFRHNIENNLAIAKAQIEAVHESIRFETWPLTILPVDIFQYIEDGAMPLTVVLGPVPPEFQEFIEDALTDLHQFFHSWFPLNATGSGRVQFLGKSWKKGFEGIDPHVHRLYNHLKGHPTLVLELKFIKGSLAIEFAHWTCESAAPLVDVALVPNGQNARLDGNQLATLLKVITAGAADAHFFQYGLPPILPRVLPSLLDSSTHDDVLEQCLQRALQPLMTAFPAWNAELTLLFALGLAEAGALTASRNYLQLSLGTWVAMRQLQCDPECFHVVLTAASQQDHTYLRLLDRTLECLKDESMIRQLRSSGHHYTSTSMKLPNDRWIEE